MAAIFEVYSRSWFFLRWHKLIYALPAFYFLGDVISSRVRLLNSILLNTVIDLLSFVLGIFLELFLIINILVYKDFDTDVSTWSLIKRYFWRACGIHVASAFWALVLLSPFCFFVYLAILAELNSLFGLFLIVALLALSIIHFGINELGLRIMVSRNRRISESMWQGFKELSAHQIYYLPFLIASVLLSALPIFLASILSGAQIGSIGSLAALAKFITAGEGSKWSILLILNYIIIPINMTATTFIYIDRKFESVNYQRQGEDLKTST